MHSNFRTNLLRFGKSVEFVFNNELIKSDQNEKPAENLDEKSDNNILNNFHPVGLPESS